MNFTAAQIASYLNGTVEGDPEAKVSTFNKIEEGKPGGISFLANPKYTSYIYTSRASVVLVNRDFVAEHPISATLIRVDDAYACLAKLMQMAVSYRPHKSKRERMSKVAWSAKTGKGVYIGSFTYVSAHAEIGDNTQIFPQVYIGENVKIGKDCIVYPGVKIYRDCVIGDRCILQAGAVIGSDGFGFAPQEDGSYRKIPQTGNVIIEDDVEICANTCVDRATMGSTIIHKGVKLDNLIQVAHNVEIGEHTVMASQVGIAGSTKIGGHCMVGGQAGFAGHIHICDGVNIGGKTGIMNDVKDASKPLFGFIAMEHRHFLSSYVLFRKFPEIYNELKQANKSLRQEVEQLKQQTDK